MLEHDVRVGLHVAHVNLDTELFDIRMFFAQQPTHMRKEESAS